MSIITYSSSGESAKDIYLLREVSVNDDANAVTSMDNKKFRDLSPVRHPYWKLVDGTRDYNDGNYVLYYGSEACIHCTGFLFGDQQLARGSLWLERDKMSDGAWMKGYHFARNNEDLKNLKIRFLMFEDVPEVPENSKNDVTWTLPWSTWDNTELDKGRVKGEYRRHDRSAIEFRRVFEAAIKRFGDRVSGTPTIILYKKGKPAIFYHDQLPGLKREEQDKDLSSDVEFKKYIYHYYMNIK